MAGVLSAGLAAFQRPATCRSLIPLCGGFCICWGYGRFWPPGTALARCSTFPFPPLSPALGWAPQTRNGDLGGRRMGGCGWGGGVIPGGCWGALRWMGGKRSQELPFTSWAQPHIQPPANQDRAGDPQTLSCAHPTSLPPPCVLSLCRPLPNAPCVALSSPSMSFHPSQTSSIPHLTLLPLRGHPLRFPIPCRSPTSHPTHPHHLPTAPHPSPARHSPGTGGSGHRLIIPHPCQLRGTAWILHIPTRGCSS